MIPKINETTFKLYLDHFIKGIPETSHIVQQQNKVDLMNLRSIKSMQNFSFTNKMTRRRIIDKNSARLITLPYGFNFANNLSSNPTED